MVRKKMWNKGKKRQHKNKKQKWYSFIKDLIRNKNRTKKTCNGGKKKATPEQKQQAREWKKERIRITNLVARDETLDRKCCICGKENSAILHNKENPNLITFLCMECRKNKENIKEAEKHRFDLQEYRDNQLKEREDKYYVGTKKFSAEEVREIIEGYDKHSNILTFGEYAEQNGLSRHQFNQLQERYIEFFPERAYVITAIHNRSKAIQRNKLSIAAIERNLQKNLRR